MGSISGRWGNKGGRTVPALSFTAAGQDSGAVGYGELGIGWKEFLFQLTGNGQGLAITVYGTIDVETASGNGSEWFVIPSPSTEANAQWCNPMSPGPTTCALQCKAPIIAFRATSANAVGNPPVTGTSTLQAFVVS